VAGIVSREAELAAIAEFLDAAAEAPHALIVQGEAGVGKTTLWMTAVEQARERGVRVLSARASAAESLMAYGSLADLFTGIEPTAWEGLPDPQRIALDGALLRTTAGEALPSQRAVAAGFLAVVEDLAAASPVLIAIDDLQWLDSSSLDFS
jgi:predicted ATPase